MGFFSRVGKALKNVVTLGGHDDRKQKERAYKAEKDKNEAIFRQREDLFKKREAETNRQEYERRRSAIDKKRALIKSKGTGRSSLFFKGNKLGVIGENTLETLG